MLMWTVAHHQLPAGGDPAQPFISFPTGWLGWNGWANGNDDEWALWPVKRMLMRMRMRFWAIKFELCFVLLHQPKTKPTKTVITGLGRGYSKWKQWEDQITNRHSHLMIMSPRKPCKECVSVIIGRWIGLDWNWTRGLYDDDMTWSDATEFDERSEVVISPDPARENIVIGYIHKL